MDKVPNKGGLAIPQGMAPMDHIMLNAVMPIMRELYGNTIKEQRAHKDTLALLQAIKSGQIAPEQVIVTDDGWQLQTVRPQGDKSQEITLSAPTSQNGGLATADVPPLEELLTKVGPEEPDGNAN